VGETVLMHFTCGSIASRDAPVNSKARNWQVRRHCVGL